MPNCELPDAKQIRAMRLRHGATIRCLDCGTRWKMLGGWSPVYALNNNGNRFRDAFGDLVCDGTYSDDSPEVDVTVEQLSKLEQELNCKVDS